MKKLIALAFITLMFCGLAVQADVTVKDYDESTWQNIEMDGNFGAADCGEN